MTSQFGLIYRKTGLTRNAVSPKTKVESKQKVVPTKIDPNNALENTQLDEFSYKSVQNVVRRRCEAIFLTQFVRFL